MMEALEAYLDRIVSITVVAEGGLPEETPEDTACLDRARQEMARILTAYQLFSHRELFEPLMASTDPGDIACGRQLKAECITLAEDFRSYARQWSAEDVRGRWPVYRPAALAMIGRVRRHVFKVRRNAHRLGVAAERPWLKAPDPLKLGTLG